MGATPLSAAAALVPAGTAVASTESRHRVDYVALGDSYASAPLVPTQVDPTCQRSDRNYPSLVARSRSRDADGRQLCGATTKDTAAPQSNGVPAQFAALNRDTDLVTATIGGNDIGFSTVLGTCAHLTSGNPAGAPCTAYFAGAGADQITDAIAATGPKVAQVLRGIHRRAPHARVVVVGYPHLFPEDGVGCTSSKVPLAAGDFA